jgi:hypothetical protein
MKKYLVVYMVNSCIQDSLLPPLSGVFCPNCRLKTVGLKTFQKVAASPGQRAKSGAPKTLKQYVHFFLMSQLFFGS